MRAVSALLASVIALACLSPASAEQAGKGEAASARDKERVGFSARQSKTGFTDGPPTFGGPTSTEGDLEEADRKTTPAFRFPAVDAAFKPWQYWKSRVNADRGVQVSVHYSTLFQQLSDSLSGEDKASSGVLRGTLKWTVVGRGTENWGALNVMADHRHGFRDVTPADLGAEAGYLGLTGTFYNDIGFALINLNWTQAFNEGRSGIIAGRYDPNDYQNVLGMVNPWTIFSNLAVNLDTTVALPDSSWGVGGGTWLTDQWYALGGINDANGLATDDLDFFSGGAEFYKYAHVGWSPSRAERYFKNVHVLAWHVDEREDAGIDSAHGFALAANWTLDDRWMIFGRLGWSDATSPIYNESMTLGFIRKFFYRSDLVGFAANRGSPPDGSLRDQTSIEAFWRFQFSQGLAITPSIQLLLDPALNSPDDAIWVWGLRFRLAL